MAILVEVVDAINGRPAVGAQVALQPEVDAQWQEGTIVRTDAIGCVTVPNAVAGRGRYRVSVDLDEYFAGFGITPIQSRIELLLRVFHPDTALRLLLTITSSSSGAHVLLSGTDGPPRPPI